MADGVLLNYTDYNMVQWSMELLERKQKNFRIGVYPPTSVSLGNEAVVPLEFRFSAAIVALGVTSSVSKQFGLSHILSSPKFAMKKKGKLTPAIVDTISDDVLQRFGLYGSVEKIVEYTERLEALGVESIVFGPPFNQQSNGIAALLEGRFL